MAVATIASPVNKGQIMKTDSFSAYATLDFCIPVILFYRPASDRSPLKVMIFTAGDF
jgi:hypothetical protein